MKYDLYYRNDFIPATILDAFIALLTIMIESLRDLSASYNCCSFTLSTIFKQIISFSTNLHFFKITILLIRR